MVDIGDLAGKILGGAKKLPDDTIKLKVNGAFYEGWQTITVKRSIKAIAGGFDLGVVTKWADQMKPWAISPGDECGILVGKETLITGYVDDVQPSIAAGDSSVNINGRDKAGDLVDCSIDQKPSAWTNISLLSLCQRVAKGFGIGVVVAPAADAAVRIAFPAWKINQGESAFETMDRAAKQRGVLLTNDGQGNILITRASTERASSNLVEGQNILSASANFTMKERYSQYKVKAQDGGLDGADPGVDFSPEGRATDPGVKRFRPIMIVAEGAATISVCRIRAQWEAAVRVGKSTSVNVTIPGWRQADGSLWRPNQVTRVNAPGLGINIDLLITEVTLKESNEDQTTSMLLEPASAYVPDPTLNTRKDPWRQLVLQESSRK